MHYKISSWKSTLFIKKKLKDHKTNGSKGKGQESINKIVLMLKKVWWNYPDIQDVESIRIYFYLADKDDLLLHYNKILGIPEAS